MMRTLNPTFSALSFVMSHRFARAAAVSVGVRNKIPSLVPITNSWLGAIGWGLHWTGIHGNFCQQ